ncbi:hypothetical protein [Candidatus Nitrotoga arctica]|uniref:2,3-bisphosphoglycerate-independent phosphoglycerate mutase n=1 Tax=Candidatus Nitrotoga arctica TaxID=453162 RepID=A0ABM8YZF9_9PROT|nr:hypothetical protein [Candidatus Nitrotoga arctica]CAG9932923.1 conserved protein of unknown function [Candidatus Nitrotoga arctica]
MKNVDIVILDLFLPQEISVDACADLSVPVLEKMLARAKCELLPSEVYSTGTLEEWLCRAFGIARQLDEPIAPITVMADGMQPGTGYWLRADPVHLQMQRTQLFLHPDVPLNADEATQLCASLNTHFAAEGLSFFSPHPQRWYLYMESIPDIVTRPLSQVAGRNVQTHLPKGQDALRWHKIFNEIQMLFFEHAVNQAREVHGDLPINSIWLWGGGHAVEQLARPYTKVCGDSFLAGAFAQAAGISYQILPDDLSPYVDDNEGDMLIIWEGLRRPFQQGDLHAWRDSVQCLEQSYIAPLWKALRNGHIKQLSLNVLNAGVVNRFVLTRSAVWKPWRLSKSLAQYALA